jgi:hypothetical protein
LPRTHGASQTPSMRFPLASIAPLLLAACGAGHLVNIASSPTVKVGEDFDLAVGQAVLLADTSDHVHFAKVIEDSRCPMNARCIWEGNAKVAVNVGSLSAMTLELNTSERFKTRDAYLGYDVVLVHLEPTPMTGEKVTKYVATLRVEARP